MYKIPIIDCLRSCMFPHKWLPRFNTIGITGRIANFIASVHRRYLSDFSQRKSLFNNLYQEDFCFLLVEIKHSNSTGYEFSMFQIYRLYRSGVYGDSACLMTKDYDMPCRCYRRLRYHAPRPPFLSLLILDFTQFTGRYLGNQRLFLDPALLPHV